MPKTISGLIKDENYFEKRNGELIKRNPIEFMAYVANEMTKIAVHEGNEKQERFFKALSSISPQYMSTVPILKRAFVCFRLKSVQAPEIALTRSS